MLSADERHGQRLIESPQQAPCQHPFKVLGSIRGGFFGRVAPADDHACRFAASVAADEPARILARRVEREPGCNEDAAADAILRSQIAELLVRQDRSQSLISSLL